MAAPCAVLGARCSGGGDAASAGECKSSRAEHVRSHVRVMCGVIWEGFCFVMFWGSCLSRLQIAFVLDRYGCCEECEGGTCGK